MKFISKLHKLFVYVLQGLISGFGVEPQLLKQLHTNPEFVVRNFDS